MKKVIAFLRSMTFGLILLVIILGLSVAGSLIPQDRTAMEYVSRFGEGAARWILRLGLDHVFRSPLFLVPGALLCLNLIACSLVRFPRVHRACRTFAQRAAEAPVRYPLTPEQAEQLQAQLKRWKSEKVNGKTVYLRGRIGHYGSFLTHLALLLVVVVGGLALALPQITDLSVMPGETIVLDDGALVTVDSFHIEDETGRLDYASKLTAVTADGQTLTGEIRVNEPMRVGSSKIYQQTYGTAGRVLVENLANGAADTLYLTEPCFLSLDGQNGVFFRALYPGYIRMEDGSMTLITSTSGAYSDPVYELQSVTEGMAVPVLAFPGETITIGDVCFTLLEPAAYPGLRIKRLPGILLGLLYFVFAFLVAALALCFFVVPVAVRIEPEGLALLSPREGIPLELNLILEEDRP